MKLTRKEWSKVWKVVNEKDIDPHELDHINQIRHHPGETIEHLMGKVKKSRELYQRGIPHLTEAHNNHHTRKYDLVNLFTGEIEEFETGKSYDKNDGSVKVNV